MISERAYAKLNLVLQVGPPRGDGLHPLCSLFASLELADELSVEEWDRDELHCPAVDGDNLATRALEAMREAAPSRVPPLRVRIDKRIPVAAGLGGGSADAAAMLRAANQIAGRPLDGEALCAVAASLGSDVPSQVEPVHALVTGVGDELHPLSLPDAAIVLLPAAKGLAAAEAYAELDRLRGWRRRLDPEGLVELASRPLARLADSIDNDLRRAILSLRPELERALVELREAGAIAADLAGSGPTAYGLFESDTDARVAAAGLAGAIVTRTRSAA